MKCLVTGGAGFIGSHLIERLLNEGHTAIIIDDLSSGNENNLVFNGHKHPIIRTSIRDANIDSYFKDIDIVFHLAALTRPQWSIAHPCASNMINVDGMLSVLQASINNNVKRFIFASSASVYGEQKIFPSAETYPPNPISPYGLQKLIGEQYCKLYSQIYNLKFNALRFFNVYGPRMNPNSEYAGAISLFVKALVHGKSPDIFGDGEQARDFVYISDVIDAVMLATTSETVNEVFNIGSGYNISINRVYETIKTILNSDIIANHIAPKIEPRITLANYNKAKFLLDWNPKVNFLQGINQYLEVTKW